MKVAKLSIDILMRINSTQLGIVMGICAALLFMPAAAGA